MNVLTVVFVVPLVIAAIALLVYPPDISTIQHAYDQVVAPFKTLYRWLARCCGGGGSRGEHTTQLTKTPDLSNLGRRERLAQPQVQAAKI